MVYIHHFFHPLPLPLSRRVVMLIVPHSEEDAAAEDCLGPTVLSPDLQLERAPSRSRPQRFESCDPCFRLRGPP